MEAALLAVMLSCADGAWILAGISDANGMSEADKSQVRIEIIQVMPDNCSPEQYSPSGRK